MTQNQCQHTETSTFGFCKACGAYVPYEITEAELALMTRKEADFAARKDEIRSAQRKLAWQEAAAAADRAADRAREANAAADAAADAWANDPAFEGDPERWVITRKA